MTNEKRLIDANAIPWEEHYVPDPNSDRQWDYKTELCVLKPVVDQMPTVDAVEIVHGRWLPAYKVNWWMGTETIDGFTCNQCARYFKSKLRLNYCPNCGAKMYEEN